MAQRSRCISPFHCCATDGIAKFLRRSETRINISSKPPKQDVRGRVQVLILHANRDFNGGRGQLKPILNGKVSPRFQLLQFLDPIGSPRYPKPRVKKRSTKASLPERATPGSIGFDIFRYVFLLELFKHYNILILIIVF